MKELNYNFGTPLRMKKIEIDVLLVFAVLFKEVRFSKNNVYRSLSEIYPPDKLDLRFTGGFDFRHYFTFLPFAAILSVS